MLDFLGPEELTCQNPRTLPSFQRSRVFFRLLVEQITGIIYIDFECFISRKSHYWRSLFSVDAIPDSLRIFFGTGRSQRGYYDDGTWDMDGTLTFSPQRRYATQSRLSYSWQMANKDNSVIFDELLDVLDFVVALLSTSSIGQTKGLSWALTS